MDWSSIIYAGLGGGLGGLIGGLIGLKLYNKTAVGTITTVLVIAGLQGLPTLYKSGKLPRIIPLDVSITEAESPALHALEAHYPAKYRELISIFDIPARNKNITPQVKAKFREELVIFYEDLKTKAPAKVYRETNELGLLQINILTEKRPDICSDMLKGFAYDDVGNILGKEYVDSENKVAVSLVSLPKDEFLTPVPPEEGETIYMNIITEVLEALAIAPEKILEPRDHKINCEFIKSIYVKSSKLDDENLRKFMSYQTSLLRTLSP